MKRFYDCVIHPKEMEEWSNESCPTGENDCDNCEYCKYIGTFAGKYYIDCSYGDVEEEEN